MTISCMGFEAYICDLFDNPWCPSYIDFYSDIPDEATSNDYFTADKAEVWSLAYEELYCPKIIMPSSDFPMFDHIVTLSVRWSFCNRYLYESTFVEQVE